MQYQSPGFAIADTLYQGQMDRVALQHQALLDSLAQQREAREAKYQDAEVENMKLDRQRKEREDFVSEVRNSMVPGDIPPAEWLEKDKKLGTHLFDQSGPQSPLATGKVVPTMPASPTETPVTVPSIRTYRGTPDQAAMRDASQYVADPTLRGMMSSGAPGAAIKIVADEQTRRDTLAARAEEQAASLAERYYAADLASKDREAAQAATAAYRQQTLELTKQFRANQVSEQQFRNEMAKASLDLRRQIFETTKANDLTPTQRAAFNKIVAEKMKAATPSTIGGALNGFNWSIPDDQADQILNDAYTAAKGVGTAPGEPKLSPADAALVNKLKGK